MLVGFIEVRGRGGGKQFGARNRAQEDVFIIHSDDVENCLHSTRYIRFSLCCLVLRLLWEVDIARTETCTSVSEAGKLWYLMPFISVKPQRSGEVRAWKNAFFVESLDRCSKLETNHCVRNASSCKSDIFSFTGVWIYVHRPPTSLPLAI